MSTVNDQITDSVTQNATLLTGYAAPQGMAMLDVVGAETLGMVMHNATTAQQNAQITGSASVAATCARMLATEPIQPPTVAPVSETPPPFMPLNTDGNSGSPADFLKMATAMMDKALKEIKEKEGADTTTDNALDQLKKIMGEVESATKDIKQDQDDNPPPKDDNKDTPATPAADDNEDK